MPEPIRWRIALSSLLLLSSISHGYVWVTPITKCPYPHAPDLYSTPPMYYRGPDCQIYGPYWCLRPPFPPYQNPLPGQIGKAIMEGYLPPELLKSKEAMAHTLDNMPTLGKKKEKKDGQHGGPPHGGPPHGPPGMPPGMGGPPPGHGPDPMAPNMSAPYGYGVPGPYPMTGPGAMPPGANVQAPYLGHGAPGAMGPPPPPFGMPGPGMPYPAPMPYPPPGPPGMMPGGGMPYPVSGPMMGRMPNGGVPMPYPPRMPIPPGMPMMYPRPMPVPQPPMMPHRPASYEAGGYPPGLIHQDPSSGIWLVQNVQPNARPVPLMMPPPPRPVPYVPVPMMPRYPYVPYGPIPMPGMPTRMPYPPPMPVRMPMAPGMAMTPGMFPFTFAPYARFDPFMTMNLPRGPEMGPLQMQLPRMDMIAPPVSVSGGNSLYPTHPFTRSPRDFFMWGEYMEDERDRGNQPFLVP